MDGRVDGVDSTSTTASSTPGGDDGSRATRDSLAVVVSRLLVAGLGWAGTTLIARTLSPEDWGHFSFVFGLLSLMDVVTDLGVGRAVVSRLLDDDEDEVRRTAAAFVALRAALGVVGYVTAVAYAALVGLPGEVVAATAIAGVVILFASPSQGLLVLYQSRLRLTWTAVGDVLSQVVQLALTLSILALQPVFLLLVLPNVVFEIVNLCWRAAGVRRGMVVRPARRVEIRRWAPLLRESIPLTIGYALLLVLAKVDILLLERMDTVDTVGLYAVGYKFADVLTTAVIAAIAPVTTLLVAAWPGDRGTFGLRARQAAVLLLMLAGLGVVAYVPVAGQAITTLYGERYVAAADASRMLFVAAGLSTLTLLAITTMISAGLQRVFPWVAAAGLVMNVVLNVLWIPRWSLDGAAAATLVTQIAMVLACWVTAVVGTRLRDLVDLPRLLALLGAIAALTVGLAWAASATGLPWPVVSCVGVVAYLGLAAAFPISPGVSPLGLFRERRRARG